MHRCFLENIRSHGGFVISGSSVGRSRVSRSRVGRSGIGRCRIGRCRVRRSGIGRSRICRSSVSWSRVTTLLQDTPFYISGVVVDPLLFRLFVTVIVVDDVFVIDVLFLSKQRTTLN